MFLSAHRAGAHPSAVGLQALRRVLELNDKLNAYVSLLAILNVAQSIDAALSNMALPALHAANEFARQHLFKILAEARKIETHSKDWTPGEMEAKKADLLRNLFDSGLFTQIYGEERSRTLRPRVYSASASHSYNSLGTPTGTLWHMVLELAKKEGCGQGIDPNATPSQEAKSEEKDPPSSPTQPKIDWSMTNYNIEKASYWLSQLQKVSGEILGSVNSMEILWKTATGKGIVTTRV